MKTEISVFPWANIGKNDHSNPYIESTTVLSDTCIVVVTCTLYLPVCPGELGSVVWLQMGGRRRALHQHQSGPEPHARLSVPAHTPDNRAVLVTYVIYVYMYNYVCIPWWGHKMVL